MTPKQMVEILDGQLTDCYAEIEGKNDRIADLEAALTWYAEHVPDCRKTGLEGDVARGKLDRDGGSKARAALEGGG